MAYICFKNKIGIHRKKSFAYRDTIGCTIYYLNDNLHKEDGPAVLFDNGKKNVLFK